MVKQPTRMHVCLPHARQQRQDSVQAGVSVPLPERGDALLCLGRGRQLATSSTALPMRGGSEIPLISTRPLYVSCEPRRFSCEAMKVASIYQQATPICLLPCNAFLTPSAYTQSCRSPRMLGVLVPLAHWIRHANQVEPNGIFRCWSHIHGHGKCSRVLIKTLSAPMPCWIRRVARPDHGLQLDRLSTC